MWQILYVLLIISNDLSALSKSSELTEDDSKTVRNYEHQDFHPKGGVSYQDEYVEEKYSNADRRELLGKWRNNGEALEPKWRDGDSVPLGPLLHAVPFQNNQRMPHHTKEIYKSQSQTQEEKWKNNNLFLRERNYHTESASDRASIGYPEYWNTNISKNTNSYHENGPESYEFNLERLISSTERYPIDRDYEHTHRNGYKNYESYESRLRSVRKNSRPAPEIEISDHDDDPRDSRTNSYRNKNSESEDNISSRLYYPNSRIQNFDSNTQNDDHTLKSLENSYETYSREESQSTVKHRENFQSHPNEYDLSEDEYEKPRPRKRRPPQSYEFLESGNSYSEFQSDQNHSSESIENKKDLKIDKTSSKSYRRPYSSRDTGNASIASQTNEPRNEDRGKLSEIADLKSLLKMQDGLSLSEILQQKNLSLSDLLRGKANAMSVLKSINKNPGTWEEEPSYTRASGKESSESFRRENTTYRPRWSPNQSLSTRKLDDRKRQKSHNTSKEITDLPKRVLMGGSENSVRDPNEKFPFIDRIQNLNPTEILITRTNTDNDSEAVDSNRSSDKKIIDTNPSKRRLLPDTRKIDTGSLKVRFMDSLESIEDLSTKRTTVTEHVLRITGDDATGSMFKDKSISEDIGDDEIMEFSDFTVKKSKSTTPKFVPYTLKPDRIFSTTYTTVKPTNNFEDNDPKLSIEHILTTTEEAVTPIPIIVNYSSKSESHESNANLHPISIGHNLKDIQNLTEINRGTTNSSQFTDTGNTNENIFGNMDSSDVESGYQNDGTDQNVQRNTTKTIQDHSVGNENQFVNEERIEAAPESSIPIEKEDKTLFKNHQHSSSDHKLYDKIISEVEPDARAEIFELFSSGSGGERLERLLKSRNMSIEELIALRQRGSSQVHLAEVFKTREQSQKSKEDKENLNETSGQPIEEEQQKNNEDIQETHILLQNYNNVINDSNATLVNESLMNTESVKIANRKHEYLSKEVEELVANLSDLFIYHKNASKIEQKLDETGTKLRPNIKTAVEERVTEASLRKSTQNLDLITTFDSLPFSRNIQRDSEGSSYYTSITEVKIPTHARIPKRHDEPILAAKYPINNPSGFSEIGRVEEILNNDLRSSSDIYRSDHENHEKKTLPNVKPSIIASGAILGVTIIVFLAIFIACRIRQKQRFTYRSSFAKAVFHSPIMAARKLSNTSSLNTIMVNVVATSTTKRPYKNDNTNNGQFESKSDIENDSLDANDSWETIPDFMK